MYGRFAKIHKCPNDAREFFALFRMLVDRLPEMELDRWATKSWALWNARNKYYFEHVQQQPKVILEGALGFLAEYQRLLAAMNNSLSLFFDSSVLWWCFLKALCSGMWDLGLYVGLGLRLSFAFVFSLSVHLAWFSPYCKPVAL